MRKLSLHEKITLKGKFAKKKLSLPKLNMKEALHFWYMCFGTPIAQYAKVPNKIIKRKNNK